MREHPTRWEIATGLVDPPVPETASSRISRRREHISFAPPPLRREGACLGDDEDGGAIRDIESAPRPPYHKVVSSEDWGRGLDHLPRVSSSSSEPPAGEEELDEEHHAPLNYSEATPDNNGDNCSVSSSSIEVPMSLVTSLVDDPSVEPQDAVIIRFTSPGPRLILTVPPTREAPPLPQSRPFSLCPETSEEVDPASVPLPEMDTREVYHFMELPWPDMTPVLEAFPGELWPVY
jgi:hypothetical protein